MAKPYRLTRGRRLVNTLMRELLRFGLAPKTTYLLTVPGWRTGGPRSTPVIPVEEDGRRWLVSPYGEVGWVRNARAAGRATLSRGRRSETLDIIELNANEAGPVLKRYVASVPITRPFFDAGPDAPIQAFIVEASRHPVFRLLGPTSSASAQG